MSSADAAAIAARATMAHDIFSDAAHAALLDAPPAWVLAAEATLPEPTGAFEKIPPEILQTMLSFLPSSDLANFAATASWPPLRGAVAEAVDRLGLALPARRLGESWPCALKRAELRHRSRSYAPLSAGFTSAAWISAEARATFVQLQNCYVRWRPEPPLPRARAVAVSCGSLHSVVLLEDSTVIRLEQPRHNQAWDNETRPCKWSVIWPAAAAGEERIVSVDCGAFHTLFVGEHGGLWSHGSNQSGQLGAGQIIACVAPLRVDLFHKALQASGGGHHSLVLTHSGGILSFGHGSSGQLGLGDTSLRRLPCRVPIPGGEVAVAVAAGGDFSLVLTETGELFGFGSLNYGVLGPPPPSMAGVQKLPARLPMPALVTQVAAGYDHALAVTASGQVLSWGSAGYPSDVFASSAGGAAAAATQTQGVPTESLGNDDAVNQGANLAPSPPPSGISTPMHAAQSVPVAQLGNGPGASALASRFGQLARPIPSPDEPRQFAGNLAFSSVPAPATALGPCALVAAGSFCSIGIALEADGAAADSAAADSVAAAAPRDADRSEDRPGAVDVADLQAAEAALRDGKEMDTAGDAMAAIDSVAAMTAVDAAVERAIRRAVAEKKWRRLGRAGIEEEEEALRGARDTWLRHQQERVEPVEGDAGGGKMLQRLKPRVLVLASAPP